jgi:hypothetical protein
LRATDRSPASSRPTAVLSWCGFPFVSRALGREARQSSTTALAPFLAGKPHSPYRRDSRPCFAFASPWNSFVLGSTSSSQSLPGYPAEKREYFGSGAGGRLARQGSIPGADGRIGQQDRRCAPFRGFSPQTCTSGEHGPNHRPSLAQASSHLMSREPRTFGPFMQMRCSGLEPLTFGSQVRLPPGHIPGGRIANVGYSA